jgi:hypothetical protein
LISLKHRTITQVWIRCVHDCSFVEECLLRHGVDVNHRLVGNPKRKV